MYNFDASSLPPDHWEDYVTPRITGNSHVTCKSKTAQPQIGPRSAVSFHPLASVVFSPILQGNLAGAVNAPPCSHRRLTVEALAAHRLIARKVVGCGRCNAKVLRPVISV